MIIIDIKVQIIIDNRFKYKQENSLLDWKEFNFSLETFENSHLLILADI